MSSMIDPCMIGMYLLVEFVDEGTTSPVAAEWYHEGISWWPPYTDKAKLLKSIRGSEVPNVSRGWTQHQARILYSSDCLDKVVQKWRISCETSDLNSDNDFPRKRKPKKPFEFIEKSQAKWHPSPQKQNLKMKKKTVHSLPPPPIPPPPPADHRNPGTNRSMMSQDECFQTNVQGYSYETSFPESRQVMSKAQSYQGRIQDAWFTEPTQQMMSQIQLLSQDEQSTITEQMTEDNQSVGLESHCDILSAGPGRLVPGQCTPAERAILEMLGELQLQVQHLTSVITQRGPFLGNSSLKMPPAPADKEEEDGLPLESIQALNDFEVHLQNKIFKQKLVSKLSLVGGQTLKKTVWRICGKVFAPQLAVQLNWCGRGEKMAIKNIHLKDTIVLSAMRNPLLPTPNEAEAEKIIKEWLRLSSDRLRKRQR
ncbi:uncharacterized protein LOC134326645 isoform X3 [Trichomycterus rosablanca]|uniref:uncharacterized protein LOC134326645 isoform X3 n=1 Tax=Trichomycterus rosablanca TaxID=2290929 RepID=UPI002F356B39